MSSGYSGPGGPEFYTSGGINGRSVMNSAQPPYRSPQLPGILVDPASQIVHRRPDLIGKRPLADFQGQAHHQFLNNYQYHQQHPQPSNANLGVLLRSVKPRTHYHTSPISPLSPVDFNAAISPEMISSVSSTLAPPPPSSGRYGLSLLRPQLNARALNGIVPNSNPVPEERKTTMNQQLQELEKQLLLDDDEYDKGDSVSVITGSEWSGAIVPNFVSPSPTSSTASSSSSSSVASPPQACPKQSLLDAASAAAEGNPEKALEILTRVAQASDVKGRSDQRMAAHMAAGLRRRVVRVDGPPLFLELREPEHAAAMQKLYEVSPCFKLGLWAANQAILDATSDLPEKIHVVDFEGLHVGGASQYLNLVQQLVARRPEPPALKITCVASEHGSGGPNGGCEEQLRKLGVKLSFLNLRLCDLSRDALGCEPGEALAVNLAFKLYGMPDESVRTDNPRDELLRRVKGLAPRVVAVVEQEMNGNTAPLVARVGEVFSYYGALFDSLDSALPRESPERARVEEALGRKMANTVACEGMERLERCEMFGKWRARLRMAGFEQRPLSQSVAESLVNSAPRGNVGITVKEESGGIWLGWMGRTLAVASAWR